jgi:hypothetical protein
MSWIQNIGFEAHLTEILVETHCGGAVEHHVHFRLQNPASHRSMAVPDGRHHGHFPEMWQFYKLDVRGKLVAVKVAMQSDTNL